MIAGGRDSTYTIATQREIFRQCIASSIAASSVRLSLCVVVGCEAKDPTSRTRELDRANVIAISRGSVPAIMSMLRLRSADVGWEGNRTRSAPGRAAALISWRAERGRCAQRCGKVL
jgi:hypothetical protein